MMSSYDEEILNRMGYEMVVVDSEELENHPQVLGVLLEKVDGELALPTYVSLDTREVLEGGRNSSAFAREVSSLFPFFSLEGGDWLPLTQKRLELELLLLFGKGSLRREDIPQDLEVNFQINFPEHPPVERRLTTSYLLDNWGSFCRVSNSHAEGKETNS